MVSPELERIIRASAQSNECDLVVVRAQLIAADGKVRPVLDGRLRELNQDVIPLLLEDLDLQPASGRFVLARFPFALDVFTRREERESPPAEGFDDHGELRTELARVELTPKLCNRHGSSVSCLGPTGKCPDLYYRKPRGGSPHPTGGFRGVPGTP